MSEKKIDIKIKYSDELQEINNKLDDLEKGRIYELHQAKMYGYLATNVGQLKKLISELINKIEYDKDSTDDILAKTLFCNISADSKDKN